MLGVLQPVFLAAADASCAESGLPCFDHCHLTLAGRRPVAAEIAMRVETVLPAALAGAGR